MGLRMESYVVAGQQKVDFVKQTPDGFHDNDEPDGSLSNITQTHRIGEGSPAWSPAPQAVSL